MPEFSQLVLFLTASILLTLAPGPDILYLISQSIVNGRQAGFSTALGLVTGCLIHTVAAALGVSVIFQTSATAFGLLKWLGATYLLWLAWQTIQHRQHFLSLTTLSPVGVRLFRTALLMNVLNPKVALFFLAFLPQFTAPNQGLVWLQMFFLGSLFALQSLLIFVCVANMAGGLKSWLVAHRQRIGNYPAWVVSGVYTGLALKLALTER